MKTLIVLTFCTFYVFAAHSQTEPSKVPVSKNIKPSTSQYPVNATPLPGNKSNLSGSVNNSTQDISSNTQKMKLAPPPPKSANKPIEEDRPQPPPIAITPTSKSAIEK